MGRRSDQVTLGQVEHQVPSMLGEASARLEQALLKAVRDQLWRDLAQRSDPPARPPRR